MKTSNTPQIKSISPGLSPRTEDKTAVKQTGTDKAPHLDREAGLKKLFNSRTEFAIGFKAFFKSIGSDKKMDTIKTAMKESMKADYHDRMDRKEKLENKEIKAIKTPTLSEILKAKQALPFDLASIPFQKNSKLVLSTQIDVFIDEAKSKNMKNPEQISAFVNSFVEKLLMERLSLTSALSYNRDSLLSIANEFKTEGRSLKADILTNFITVMDDLLSKDGSIAQFSNEGKTNLDEEIVKASKDKKAADAFLRGKAYDPIGLVLHSHGLNKLAKHMESAISDLVTVQDFKDIPPTTQLKSENGKKEYLTPLHGAALKMIDALNRFEVPQDLRDKISEQTARITDAVKNKTIDAEMGKNLMHKWFNNAVILRVVNPSLTSSDKANVHAQSRQLNLLSQFVQAILNGNTSANFKNKEAGTEFDRIAGGLSNKLNQILVDKFGMPNDVFEVKPEPDAVQNQPEPPSFQDFLAAQRQPVDGGQVNPPENN